MRVLIHSSRDRLGDHLRMMQHPTAWVCARALVWTTALYIIVSVMALYPADFVHLTWWYHGLMAVYAFLSIVGQERAVYFFTQTVAVAVWTTVFIMGQLECRLFEDAIESAGPAVYVGGDFYLHWLWFLVTFIMTPWYVTKMPLEQAIAQVWLGLSFLLAWLYFHNAWTVYGCDLPKVTMVAVPLCEALIASFIMWYAWTSDFTFPT